MSQDAAESAAAAWVQATKGLKPVLLVMCPGVDREPHTLGRVYRTRWGLYLAARPVAVPGGAAGEIGEAATVTTEALAGSGLLHPDPERWPVGGVHYCGCRCGPWAITPSEILAAAERGDRTVTAHSRAMRQGSGDGRGVTLRIASLRRPNDDQDVTGTAPDR